MSIVRWRSFLRFLLASRSAYFAGVLVAMILVVVVLATVGGIAAAGAVWAAYADPFASFAVLVIALAVWIGEVRQDWHASLPCRLTVVFHYKDREVMRCERAGLAAQSDMRALGQQIGAQMAGERQLDFYAPNVTHSGGQLEDGPDGILYRHFAVELRLRTLPAKVIGLPDNHVLLWQPPFDREPTAVPRA